MVVLPGWLDDVPKVDFAPEKALITQLETWAEADGWTVSDGSSLIPELRHRTDVLLERPERDQRLRLAVLNKSRRGAGAIRLDSSLLRTLELLYRPRQRRWRVVRRGCGR